MVEKFDRSVLPEDTNNMLDNHLGVGREKAVSYLPIGTIERDLGITAQMYKSIIEDMGNEAIIIYQPECCINSGAVYAYNYKELANILLYFGDLLRNNDWPTDPAAFIRRIAAEWLDEKNLIIPVIRKAFADE